MLEFTNIRSYLLHAVI